MAPLAGCMNGPGFLRQSNESNQKEQSLVVEAAEENGSVTGTIAADSNLTQVIQASSNSAIAGTSVSFPPGAIAVDTAITVSSGEAVATDETVANLGVDTTIAAAAPAVTVSSSINIDAVQPFTILLPLPDGAQLRLTDSSENMVVFYKVEKVVAGGVWSGVITSDKISLVNGFARVETVHFGTFQVAYLTKKVTSVQEVAVETKEKPEEPVVEEPKPVAKSRSTYYLRGFRSLTFGEDLPASDGLTGFVPTAAPTRVGTDHTLSKDFIRRVYKGE
jgi:hypothetical protein